MTILTQGLAATTCPVKVESGDALVVEANGATEIHERPEASA